MVHTQQFGKICSRDRPWSAVVGLYSTQIANFTKQFFNFTK